MTRHHHPLIASTIIGALIIAACGGDSDSAADAPTETTAPTTQPPASTVSPVDITTTTPATTEPPPPPECPEPPVVDPNAVAEPMVLPPPVEPDAVELFSTETEDEDEIVPPLSDPRYRTEIQGVSIAFDSVPLMWAPIVEEDRILLAIFLSGNITMVRPPGLVANESARRPDGSTPTISFDEWLDIWRPSIEILDDSTTEMSGREVRSVTYRAVDINGVFNARFGIGEYFYNYLPGLGEYNANRIVRIDLGDADPLFIIGDSFDNEDLLDKVDALLANLVIGEAVPVPRVPIAAPVWDSGQADQLVDGPCELTSVAFGGVSFDLPEESLLVSLGNHVIVQDPDGEHVGVERPRIEIIAPDVAWDADSFESDRSLGATIETPDDVVAQLVRQGWTLIERAETGSLFGAEARIFDAGGPDEPMWVWKSSDHVASEADEYAYGPFRSGEIWVADTDRGVIVATLLAERDTDDAEILMNRWTTLLDTLTFT